LKSSIRRRTTSAPFWPVVALTHHFRIGWFAEHPGVSFTRNAILGDDVTTIQALVLLHFLALYYTDYIFSASKRLSLLVLANNQSTKERKH